MQIIKRGAEAILYLGKFEGNEVLVKERIKKGYRIEQLDEKIRKFRTKKEVRLLTEARKSNIPTPKILHVDEENCKIIMEYVGNNRIKELLNRSDKKTIIKLCKEIGESIGKMHSAGIIHGDLTTSNMIFFNKKIYFIDFGLGNFSKRIEDQGTELNLLQEALKSTHYRILDICWKNIIKGYKKEYIEAEKVIKKVDEIEKRARYAKR